MSQAAQPPEPTPDAADQAQRLTMLMESELIAALHKEAASAGAQAGNLTAPVTDSTRREDYPLEDYPLEDVEQILAEEDSADASDDPLHAGGLAPTRWISAEVAAMHVIDDTGEPMDSGPTDPTKAEQADPSHEQYDKSTRELTAEDQTLLGIDPYE